MSESCKDWKDYTRDWYKSWNDESIGLYRDRTNFSKYLKRKKNKQERQRYKQGKYNSYGKYQRVYWD